MTLSREKGLNTIDVLILVGILVILLIGALFAYRYFANTYSNTRNIALIQGAQSQATLDTAKLASLDFGWVILLGNTGSHTNDTFLTNTETALSIPFIKINNAEDTADFASTDSAKKFFLVYSNTAYQTSTGTGEPIALGAFKGQDIFTIAPATDRIPAIDMPQSTIYVLVNVPAWASTAGMKKVVGISKTIVNSNGVTKTVSGPYDVYKLTN